MIPLDFNVKNQLANLNTMGIVLSPSQPLSILPKEEKTF